ncbi:MBL fold metallo-hydrolase [Sedimentibacter sp. zth1]|uniref:MBL fold metallo-hydrolase n=1 Tax=Sedimentibacter sp. zth1 TaxID=2816908 RepID=UPI001A91D832|nr:MBL fold metallo-hydrolase [Sedimentibacter sp. zth1]QSX06335.1 MBL fold metallo-hydrolase [Sedimentibacter sp. zth1]
MILERLEVTSFLMNCYIVGCEKTKNCAIIDPGGSFTVIDDKVSSLGLTPKMILLTHGHADHIGAVEELKHKYNIPVYVHEKDVEYLKNPELNHSYDLFRKNMSLDCDIIMKDGQIIELGELKILVIHTPGHTPGGVSFKIENIIITGDTIFNHSIGRTDFEGGSMEQIISSIRNKIFIYPDETVLYPGHNSPTNIGVEKRENMFLKQYYK